MKTLVTHFKSSRKNNSDVMCLVMLYFTLVLACVAGFLGFRGGERRGNWGREGRNRVKNVVLKV